MEPAEFMMKILIVSTLCFGILGMIVESTQFEGVIRGQDSERLCIDLAHAASAMPCITAEINGESRKGLLLESKLEQYDGSNACFTVDAQWGLVITDGSSTWSMGRPFQGDGPKKTLPVAIKKADGSVVPGTLTAQIITGA